MAFRYIIVGVVLSYIFFNTSWLKKPKNYFLLKVASFSISYIDGSGTEKLEALCGQLKRNIP